MEWYVIIVLVVGIISVILCPRGDRKMLKILDPEKPKTKELFLKEDDGNIWLCVSILGTTYYMCQIRESKEGKIYIRNCLNFANDKDNFLTDKKDYLLSTDEWID